MFSKLVPEVKIVWDEVTDDKSIANEVSKVRDHI